MIIRYNQQGRENEGLYHGEDVRNSENKEKSRLLRETPEYEKK